MGTMRFQVFPPERITPEVAQQAYMSGIDRIPWAIKTTLDNGLLSVQRPTSDSGRLHLPWPVAKRGLVTLNTASLMEQEETYRLPLELARGTIVELRNQLADWQTIGLAVPESVLAKLALAVGELSWATVADELAEVSQRAEKAIAAALDASDRLTAAYSEQALAVRRRNGSKAFLGLGANLGPALLDAYASRQFLLTFNSAQAPVPWRDVETTEGNFTWTTSDKQIEWCRAHQLKVLAGPLLMLDRHALPDWLYLFEDDFENMAHLVLTFVRAAVQRYRGQVDCWICAGRVNAPDALGVSEPERVRLVAGTIELVRSLDPNTPAMVSFDQPWCEYLRQQHSDFPPLHFADALLRAGLDLSGFVLEVNIGTSPGATLPRSTLEFSRQLDNWSKLGLPLWLSLSAPSGIDPDPLAQRASELPTSSWTATIQQSWVARVVPLALSKPMVRGVLWNQLSDGVPHDFPNAGLFDRNGKVKPILGTLAAIRQMCAR